MCDIIVLLLTVSCLIKLLDRAFAHVSLSRYQNKGLPNTEHTKNIIPISYFLSLVATRLKKLGGQQGNAPLARMQVPSIEIPSLQMQDFARLRWSETTLDKGTVMLIGLYNEKQLNNTCYHSCAKTYNENSALTTLSLSSQSHIPIILNPTLYSNSLN